VTTRTRAQQPALAVFATSAAVIAYTYVGFPLVLFARARLAPRPVQVDGSVELPTVSVLIAAHDEAAIIGEKVRSVLASSYPHHSIEVVVASDGSTDGTEDIIAAIEDPRVRCLVLDRVGKAAALDEAIAAATGDIVVFTDANSMFGEDTLERLVAPFADHTVGGVAGDQRYLRADDGGERDVGERRYWDLDRTMKEAESIAGNVISATGALYAVRRELCPPVPVGVTDDFAISTSVIESGHRLVFERSAAVWEPVAEGRNAEFARKVRIMTRGLRGVWLRRALLDPRRFGFYSIQLFTHKVLRRLMVIPLALLGASSVALARRSNSYAVVAAAQVSLYGLGALGLVLEGRNIGRSKVLALPAYFCMVNAAAVVALFNLLRGRRIERWEPSRSERPGTERVTT
jgi:cellulose synthase/poly-beta-1,6-N-acetylglucosamine synthase-like glycosyltransferase